MKVPQLATAGATLDAGESPRNHPASGEKPSRSWILGGVLAVAFLIGAGSGIWWFARTPARTPESKLVAEGKPLPSRELKEKPQPFEESRSSPSPRVEKPPPPPIESPPKVEVPPPPKVEEKKEIELIGDMPPELSFDLVDAINAHRLKAGVEPIFLDERSSRSCQTKAEFLARHAEKLDDKASSDDGSKSIAAEAPLSAVEKWLHDPRLQTAILEPRLRTFAAGYARNVAGQWYAVFDWTSGLDREPMDAKPVSGPIVYPAPGQMRVPLWFPGNEVPDPLPQTNDKLAGFPITLTFPRPRRIEDVQAHLRTSLNRGLDVWLSTPEKPANTNYNGSQQNTICLIAQKPLEPNTRHTVEVSATVDGKRWSASWQFETMSEGEIRHETAGAFLRSLNDLRRRAGLPPVNFHTESSKKCQAHARYLALNAAKNPQLNWNAEVKDLPGYTFEGAAVAPRASIQGGGGPIQAVMGLVHSLINRPHLLDPRLGEVGLGYTPFVLGGWIWVIEMRRVPGREVDRHCFYPAPDQENVPLVYPPNEVPSPVPADNKDKPAGYAITALFDPRLPIKAAAAHLVDENGTEIEGWLSSPDNPAIAHFPQRCLCFLPKSPLRPGTRYSATFEAKVNGRPWKQTWGFTTIKEPDRYDESLEETLLAQVNAARKHAGLPPVRLDPELSRGCLGHARYLALNQGHPAVRGLGVHRQDAGLPGASKEGAKAAKESVIAVLLDPRSCVDGWMATLYHRIPILTPNLKRVGFGLAHVEGHKWACVLDTGNGRAPVSTLGPSP